MVHKNHSTKTWGIAGLILSIFGLLLIFAPYIGIFLSITAVVFYKLQKKSQPTASATGGLVLGLMGIILNLLTLIFIFGLFVFTMPQEPSTSTNETSAQAPAQILDPVPAASIKENQKVYDMGEDIRVDYIEYKITKAEEFSQMGTSFLKEETSGKFVKVYLEITNKAKESKQIFSPRFKIIDDQGRKFDQFPGDGIYIADPLTFGEQIQPSLTKSGAIVFELPKDAENLKLSIKGDLASTSQVLVDLSKITNIKIDTTLKEKQDRQWQEAMSGE